MLIRGDVDIAALRDHPGWRIMSSRQWDVAWQGFLWSPTLGSHEAAIKPLLQSSAETFLDRLPYLLGAYLLIARNIATGTVFVSNGAPGQRALFFDGVCFSDSDIDFSDGSIDCLNGWAIAEYMSFGYVWRHQSVIKGIRKVQNGDIGVIDGAGTRLIAPRQFAFQAPKTSDDIVEFFDEYFMGLVRALDGVPFECDLTAGGDSRLVCGALKYFGGNVSSAVSGSEGFSEFATASAVARAIGIEHRNVVTPMRLRPHQVAQTIELAPTAVDLATMVRLGDLARDRQDRGIKLGISGVAGEILKDYQFLQDFPFMTATGKPNIDGIVNLRYFPKDRTFPFGQIDGPKGNVELRTEYRKNLTAEFGSSERAVAYDGIYASKATAATASFNALWSRMDYAEYSPFLERYVLHGRANIPMHQRLGARFQARLITRYAPSAAGIKTSLGLVPQYTPAGFLRSAFYASSVLARRFIRKGLNRYFNLEGLYSASIDGERQSSLADLPEAKEKLQFLVDKNLFSADALVDPSAAAVAPIVYKYVTN